MDDPDNGHEFPGSPVDSPDLPPNSPSNLFSLSNFSRFRQFFRCLLLKPDLASPDEGEGAGSPKKLKLFLLFKTKVDRHLYRKSSYFVSI